MTSKSSFFKLMKENFKRRIALPACITVLFFFIMPVSSLMSADNYMRNPLRNAAGAVDMALTKQYIYNDFTRTQDAVGGLYALIVLLAVISGVSAFAYLHNSRKTDFYHSLPVSRTRLFAVSAVNSILMTGIPYLIMAFASAVITAAKTGYAGCISYALLNCLYGMCFFALVFMTAVLAMLLTGTILAGILGTLTLMFVGPALILTADSMMENYFWSYYRIDSVMDAILGRSSPLLWAMTGGGSTAFRAVAAAVGAAVLSLICLKLYKLRHSESAGTPVAFKCIKAPVKILITIPAALLCGIFAGKTTDYSDIWTVFAILCGAVLVHSVIEIIFNADFKKLFSNRIHLAGCIIAAFAAFAFFRFDVPGYDRYIPAEEKLASEGVFSYALENVYGGEDEIAVSDSGDAYLKNVRNEQNVLDDMKLIDYADVSAVAKAGTDEIAKLRKRGARNKTDIYAYTDDGEIINAVTVAWHLKNGRTVYRQYNFDLHEVSSELESVHDSEEFKEAVFPVLTKTPEAASDIAGVNYRDVFGTHSVKLSGLDDEEGRQAIAEIYAAYCADLKALRAETRKHESPVAALQFRSAHFQSIADEVNAGGGYTGMLDDTGYYPVYPSFSKTLSVLDKNGAGLNAELTADNIASAVISSDMVYSEDTYEDGYDDEGTVSSENVRRPDLIITDKDEIKAVLDSVIYEVGQENNLNSRFYGLDVKLNLDYRGITAGEADVDTAKEAGKATAAAGESAAEESKAEERSADAEEMSENQDTDAAEAEEAAMKTSVYDSADNLNYLRFDSDKLPQFVRDYFGIDDNDIEGSSSAVGW